LRGLLAKIYKYQQPKELFCYITYHIFPEVFCRITSIEIILNYSCFAGNRVFSPGRIHMRSEDELWKKYEEQREICTTDEEYKSTFETLMTSQFKKIGLSILEWVLGFVGEKPTEEDIYAAYSKEIENHPRPKKALMRNVPALERKVKTAWLGWVLDIPDDEIKRHQIQFQIK
jgi:hypothetical protein